MAEPYQNTFSGENTPQTALNTVYEAFVGGDRGPNRQ
jgi:hypothetical protein